MRVELAFVGTIVCVATGCGSSGSDAIPAGVYGATGQLTGSFRLNGALHTFASAPQIRGVVTATGSYMFLSYATGSPDTVSQMDVGTGASSQGMFTAPDDIERSLQSSYDTSPGGVGPVVEGAALSAAFEPSSTFDATIDYPQTLGGQGDDLLTFPATWVAGSLTPPTLAQIAGTYPGAFSSNINTSSLGDNAVATGSLTIAPSGALSGTILCILGQVNGGTNAPCTVTGTVTARTDVDAFDVSLSFASGTGNPPDGGSLPSTWTGKVATGIAYFDPTRGKLVLGAAAPDNTAFAFSN